MLVGNVASGGAFYLKSFHRSRMFLKYIFGEFSKSGLDVNLFKFCYMTIVTRYAHIA